MRSSGPRLGRILPQATGGGSLPTHLAPNAPEGGLLSTFRPSWMTDPAGGDLAAARAEIVRSKYDANEDGVCDASVCKNVRMSLSSTWPLPFDPIVERDFAKIGVEVRVRRYPPDALYAKGGPDSPEGRSAMTADSWANDYPSGSAFFPDQFRSPLLSKGSGRVANDFSMLGATLAELRGWGYQVTSVPTVDGRIQRCVEEIGAQQEDCWAELDQYMMENVSHGSRSWSKPRPGLCHHASPTTRWTNRSTRRRSIRSR